jgi:hypothetical protein
MLAIGGVVDVVRDIALNGSVAKDPFRAFVAKGAIHQDL